MERYQRQVLNLRCLSRFLMRQVLFWPKFPGLYVSQILRLCTRGGWVVWVYSYGLMSNANGLFCETTFLCALFKTLIPAPVFLPIFLPPFNQVLTLILVHFFHPSFNLPTKQPPLPSQEVSEVREEKVEVPREELPCQGKVLLDPTIASPTHTTPYSTLNFQTTPIDATRCSMPCGHTISVRRWRYRRRHTQAVNP